MFGAEIQKLGRIAEAGAWQTGAGSIREADVLADYVAALVKGFDGKAYRVGWDAGNGAAGPALEKLIADKGVADNATLNRYRDAWDHAADRTDLHVPPHRAHAAALAVALVGAGKVSVDKALFGRSGSKLSVLA